MGFAPVVPTFYGGVGFYPKSPLLRANRDHERSFGLMSVMEACCSGDGSIATRRPLGGDGVGFEI